VTRDTRVMFAAAASRCVTETASSFENLNALLLLLLLLLLPRTMMTTTTGW